MMKALLHAGYELVTTDEVADALLDYVVSLPVNQPPARVELPVLRNGQPTLAQLVLSPTTPLAITTSDAVDVELEGADDAVNVLRRRTARLAGLGLGGHNDTA